MLPLLTSDLAAHALACAQGQLDPTDVQFSSDASAVIILAAPGYPGKPQKGVALGLPAPEKDVRAYHAGTRQGSNGLESSGGRVLAVTATATTLPEALRRAYDHADRVSFPGGQLRRDIGFRIGLTSA